MPSALSIEVLGDRQIVISREFDAPRALVWESMTRPEYIRRWMTGPPGWEMTACEEDTRVGGRFLCSWTGPDGAQMGISGVYREVEAPARCVRTETFNGCPVQAGEQIATLELDERDGRTFLTVTVLYPSTQSRDAALASGMKGGMEHSYSRLDDLLTTAAV